MKMSAEIKDLATALSKAQSEIEGAKKESENPFFRSNYADLASHWDSIRKPLTKNGLSVTQVTDIVADGILLETLLLHSSGQWIMGTIKVVSVKQDPQALGSAISYFRRYMLSAITGTAQIDDDGNLAQGKNIDSAVKPQVAAQASGVAQRQPPKPLQTGPWSDHLKNSNKPS